MAAPANDTQDEEASSMNPITAIAGLATTTLLWRFFFKPPFGQNIVRINTNQRIVALTFDDGPNPPYTELVLEVLAEHNVKATFFMVGNRIEKYPETTHRVIAEGHQIGNHSYSHSMLGFRSLTYIQSEIERTDRLLRQFGVVDEIVFRAPRLARFLPVAWVLAKGTRTHIGCDVWSWDWTTQNPDRIARRVLKKATPGSIILLHDGKAENEHVNRSGTAEATGRVITALKRKAYQFDTIKHCLENFN